jgi:heat shock protein HslJ
MLSPATMRGRQTPVVVRRATLTVGACVVLSLVLSACGGGGSASSVKGVLWQWTGTLENAPKHLSAVPDPQSYLLTLNDDGTFNATADCNQLNGTYTLSGSKLTLSPGAMTMAHCGPHSLSDMYVSLLHQVVSQEVDQQNQLVLGLANDAGSMFFSAP